jgi:pimeloyl-ACP methyl ester carboxylesterase
MPARLDLTGRSKLVLAAGLLLSCALAIPAYIAFAAFRLERGGFIPRRHAPRLGVAEFGVRGLRAVSFRNKDGHELAGYYAPGQSSAAIVIAHGASGERSDMAAETRLLAEAGFGVLAFDWPGHGESEGGIVWGEPERQALESALDFLSAQPEVDRHRLGAFGFSMGGYILTQVASRDARVRAVALAGTPHDAIEHTRWEYRRLGFLRREPALLAIRLAGMPVHELVPEQVIGKIAPRATLLVHGAEDQQVPDWITDRLYRAAGEPKQRLTVPGAGHGGYAEADPAGYGRALCDFFLKTLNAATGP